MTLFKKYHALYDLSISGIFIAMTVHVQKLLKPSTIYLAQMKNGRSEVFGT